MSGRRTKRRWRDSGPVVMATYWFTQTDEEMGPQCRAQMLADYWRTNCQSVVTKLIANAGTTLDLDNAPYPLEVDTFEGATTVVNGSLRVNGRMTLSTAALANGAALMAADGEIVFGGDAVIAASEPFASSLYGDPVTLVSAAAIEGTPAIDAKSFGAGARIAVVDGLVQVTVPKRQTMVLIR